MTLMIWSDPLVRQSLSDDWSDPLVRQLISDHLVRQSLSDKVV